MSLTRKTVMISSTARDLPEHRKEVMNACLSQGMFPTMMEHLPASDAEAISASLKMVDDADIYVGIFAHRYGYVPKGHKISVTEMEYNRAVERKIPRLIFVMDKDHPIKIEDIEMGKGAKKLETFKKKLLTENIVNQFKSASDLRSYVINSLSKYLESTPASIPDKEFPSLDVTAYYNALRKRYNVLALEGLTPPQKEEYLQIQLRSVFVEQSVREDTPPVELPKEVWEKLSREKEIHEEDLPSGITLDDVRKARESYYQKPSRLVLDALTDSKNKYAIILGDPGSGKSTLARYVMLSLIDPLLAGDKIQKAFEGYLPLLIELRTFAGLCAEGKCETPLEFLEHLGKTEGWGLTQSALQNHLKNDGRAIVIFDGLDEIFEPKLRETVTNQIVGFTNAYPKARVIVTSRILGYRRKILSDAGFKHFTLQDLDEKQVEDFITKWYQLAMSDRLDDASERSERILKSFKDSPSIRQLAGNPMLLTIMAIIGKHQELPRERWKLYDHAASVLIQHWDANRHLKDLRIEADFIGEDDKRELLRRLAFRMQSGDGGLAGNYIHREGLQEEFESYLKERYSKAPDQAKVIAEAMIQQFRERNFILSLYGANLYGFVHRAFLEYFCASAFVWKFEKTKELTIESLKTDVYGKHWDDQSWHEVLRLICGMVDEKWAGEIIDYLISDIQTFLPKFLDDTKPPWNMALAVQCFSETRNVSSISSTGEKLLGALCILFEHTLNKNFFLDDFIENEIVPASEAVGKNWPNRILLANWISKVSKGIIYYVQSPGKFVGFVGDGVDEIYKVVSRLKNANTRARYFMIEALSHGWLNEMSTYEILLHEILSEDYSKDYSKGFIRGRSVSALVRQFKADPRVLPLLQEWVLKSEYPDVRSAAVRALAKYYYDNNNTPLFLQDWILKSEYPDVRSPAVWALAEYYHQNSNTLLFLREWVLRSKYSDVRSAVVRALVEHYREDAETLPLLRERAVQDDDANVRNTAISALIEHYREDDGTLPLLRERAVQDEDANVRDTAVSALAEHYREDDGTLPLVRERAVQDEDANVRRTAVFTLAEHYREDGGTLPLLRERAVQQDEDANVRRTAVLALAEHYREDAETLPLLRERAIKDDSPKSDESKNERETWDKFVREIAINAIAKYWHDHPDTLPLLHDRVENDPTPWLRERCQELIEEIEEKKE